ncbi:MAG: phosphoserine phosphatase SerB [Campylobacteraceae bacterium]|jgi:phosphoserine phosphatase|nr:phosphoserine phosphatase SerB [Campylobacteraceae bacterium]
MKLAAFDFDSTLMDGETINFLADAYGVGDEVAKLTAEAMRGEIDFFEALNRRVALLKGMSEKKVINICENLPYMQGAKELIQELKDRGVKVVVFSGGFRYATDFAKKVLGFDADFSNVLHVKNGSLTGLVGGDMMFGFSKGDMLSRIQTILGVGIEETMSVGDGANDASMFEFSGLKIAFCAKEFLKSKANVIVDEKDLRAILNYVS